MAYNNRQLTNAEEIRAKRILQYRTKQQEEAFRLMPASMKQEVKRDEPVAFANAQIAYFPDFVFENAKFIVEIDGVIHLKDEKRMARDAYKDKVFRDNGYHVIRIRNEDLCVNIAFWQRLIEGLSKIEEDDSRSIIGLYIRDLNAMIKDAASRMVSLDVDDVVFWPKNQWRQIRQMKEVHEFFSCY